MMKTLVVYGTKTGCTAGIAEQIGKALSEKGVTVEIAAAQDAGPASGYDAVVVGSGVRGGAWHQAVRTWVEGNAEQLQAMPVAFFTCGLTTAQEPAKAAEVRAYTDSLVESTGVRPVDVGVFAGWYEPREFSFVERTILKMMKAPEGDHRDMKAVAEWATSTASQLGA